ncbi:MAG TPA: hypothetical protein VMW41_02825 [Candidatus Bathyarchaeia archaeon]|nr:hypothetical protein [Candidatus Bathyarchaeia archaeon]
MGKKRIKLINNEKESKKGRPAGTEEKRAVKTGKERGRITDMGQIALEEAKRIAEKEKEIENETKELAERVTKETKKLPTKAKKKGQSYLNARAKVDLHKLYLLQEAVKLAKETSISRFPGSIDLHLVAKEIGLSGQISFPHPTGKEQRIAIADDKLIEQIKKGKLDFDVLIAPPSMMAKLAPLAKTLGPKGLMPNPKNGTISENPETAAKKLAGKTQYRTEKKAPLIHLTIGRTDHSEQNLLENAKAAVNTIAPGNIKKAVLSATMGVGIKIDLGSL